MNVEKGPVFGINQIWSLKSNLIPYLDFLSEKECGSNVFLFEGRLKMAEAEEVYNNLNEMYQRYDVRHLRTNAPEDPEILPEEPQNMPEEQMAVDLDNFVDDDTPEITPKEPSTAPDTTENPNSPAKFPESVDIDMEVDFNPTNLPMNTLPETSAISEDAKHIHKFARQT